MIVQPGRADNTRHLSHSGRFWGIFRPLDRHDEVDEESQAGM